MTFLQRVADHAARVTAEHADRIACRPGCAGCCRGGLTVSPLEAAMVRAATPSPESPGERVLTVLDDGDDCAWLDPAGRCRIYEARPLVCRTHGLPLLYEVDEELHGDVCPLNFADEPGLRNVPSSDFLDQDTAFVVLAALNRAWCELTGDDPTRRVPLEP